MKRNNNSILSSSLPDEKAGNRRFWLTAFAVYIAVETAYFVINNITARVMCSSCLLQIQFDISQWLLNIIFTATLWYSLYRIRIQKLPFAVAGNILIFVVYYFLWVTVAYTLLYHFGSWLLGENRTPLSFNGLIRRSFFQIGKYVLLLTAFYALLFYYNYRRAERQRTQLAVINKEIQLNLLKQQLSPHFYFNTLNNLYGLARSNSVKLQPALHQLKNIMQYVLADYNQPKVLLKEEIKFLESYMALEKLRYEQDTVIEMEVKGKINGQTIIPLLLIQFLENAFKHGMKEKSNRSWMKAGIEVDGNELKFTVNNSYEQSGTNNGIGISSVKNILQLQYEGKHELQMQQQPGYFSVILKLNLS
jgi:two-component system, LytTR family, sensor kinase